MTKHKQIKKQIARDYLSNDDESDTEVKKKLMQLKQALLEKKITTVGTVASSSSSTQESFLYR